MLSRENEEKPEEPYSYTNMQKVCDNHQPQSPSHPTPKDQF